MKGPTKRALLLGGSNGMGLALSVRLLREGLYDEILIADRQPPAARDVPVENRAAFDSAVTYLPFNLLTDDVSALPEEVDAVLLTVGGGRVAPFEALSGDEARHCLMLNAGAALSVLRRYYARLASPQDFCFVAFSSIAGHVVSPLFSVYGAAKAALSSLCASLNAELAAQGFANRILDVSPGALSGTAFYGGENDVSALLPLAGEVLERMRARRTLFIPDYETTYKRVLERSREAPVAFGLESYAYKQARVDLRPRLVTGYMSGTFDLFHVGHLNIIRRARTRCDRLIVGVHQSGNWKGKDTFISFEERLAIVASLQYVDEAVPACVEDSDAYARTPFDRLFVGSDYQGSERFMRYEAFFAPLGVEIVYLPYTQGTSSTKLREALDALRGGAQ